MIRYPHHIFDIFRKYILYIIIFLAIPTASALYFAIPLDLDWFMGSHEKHHGYLFYAGVISLILLLMASSREHLRSYLIWSGIAAGLIALIAV